MNLDDLQNLNEKREREKRYELEGRARGHRHLEELAEEKKGKKNKTMLEILSQAVEKARYPAKARMRELALHLQSTEIEFIECPICMEVTTESDLALTVRSRLSFASFSLLMMSFNLFLSSLFPALRS